MTSPMFDKTMRVLAPLVGLALAGLLGTLAATHWAPDETVPEVKPPSSQPKRVLLTFGSRGGRCDPDACETVTVLKRNGLLSSGVTMRSEDLTRVLALRTVIFESDLEAELLVDCGASTYDGSDPYVRLPELPVPLEACQDLPPEAEDAFDELLALLQQYETGALVP